MGFETTLSSNAFSTHQHPIDSVRVDIMYVEDVTAEDIFNATQDKLIFKGVKIPVVSVEHLVAMKLFAIQNNPERKFKDFADIKEILSRTTFNRETVKEYFYKYGQEEYYEKIAGKKAKADKLKFFWDKKAQSYLENQDYLKTEQNIIHSLEEYFDFLEDIEPACINPHENQIIDKQFTL